MFCSKRKGGREVREGMVRYSVAIATDVSVHSLHNGIVRDARPVAAKFICEPTRELASKDQMFQVSSQGPGFFSTQVMANSVNGIAS